MRPQGLGQSKCGKVKDASSPGSRKDSGERLTANLGLLRILTGCPVSRQNQADGKCPQPWAEIHRVLAVVTENTRFAVGRCCQKGLQARKVFSLPPGRRFEFQGDAGSAYLDHEVDFVAALDSPKMQDGPLPAGSENGEKILGHIGFKHCAVERIAPD